MNRHYKNNKIKYKNYSEKENYEQKKNHLKGNKTISSFSDYKKNRLDKNIIKLKNLFGLKKFQLSFSKNKDKIFKNNGVKRGFEISQDLNKLIKLLGEEKNFGNTHSKNKKNKWRIKIDDYFSLNNSGVKNKNRIIKKNKTEMFVKQINKCDNNFLYIN